MKAKLSRCRLLAVLCLVAALLCSVGFAAVFAAPPADWEGEDLITSSSQYDENGWLKTNGWTADGGDFSVYNFGVSTQYQLINNTPIDLTKPFRFSMYFNGSGNVGGINLVPELKMYKGTDFTDVKENENYKGTDMRNHGSLFPFSGYLTAPNSWIVSGGLDNSASGNPFNISAAKDMPSDVDFSKYLTTVEMYVGTQSAAQSGASDVSWIKVNGEEIVYEVPLTLTRDDFKVGSNDGTTAYLNIQYNAVGAATDVVFSAVEQGDIKRDAALPYVAGASDSSATIYDYAALTEKKGYTFTVRPNTKAGKLEYLNASGAWAEVSSDKYTSAVEKDEDETEIGYTYTVKPEFFTEGYAQIYRNGLTTIFRVSYTNSGADDKTAAGAAYAMVGYRSFAAPEFVDGEASAVIEGTPKDVTIKVKQDEGVIYNADDVTLEIADHPNATFTALAEGDDYTVDFAEDIYTIVLKGTCLEEQAAADSPYLFRFVRIRIGIDTITYKIQFKADTDGWVIVADRLNSGSEVTESNGFLSFDLGQYVESPTDFGGTGIFYNTAFGEADDYTIVFEMDYPYYTCWAQFVISDTPFDAQYASHQNPTKMHMLLRGYGSDPANFPSAHGLMGFTTGAQVDISDVYTLRNKVLVEIHVGETKEDGYYKINGKLIDRPNFTQSDFPSGLYLSMLWNNTNGENSADTSIKNMISTTTVSEVVNGVYLSSDRSDAAMTYTLKSGADLEVTIANVKNAVKVYCGEKELTASDFAFDKASGKLTVKSAYLNSLPFASQYTFSVVEDGNGGTGFTVKTKVVDKGTVAMQSFSKSAPADLTFALAGTASELILNEQAVASSQYTVSGNSLTLKKDFLNTLASGNYVFYANVGASYDVLKVAVGYNVTENGIVMGDNYNIAEDAQGNISLGGGAAFQLHGTKDLTAGIDLTLFMDYAAKLYEDGLYSDGAAFNVSFADLNNGTTIVYSLFANFDEREEGKSWVCERISVYGSDGALIDSTADRKLAVKMGEGLTVNFKFTAEGFVATIGDNRASTLALTADYDEKFVAVSVGSSAYMFGGIQFAAASEPSVDNGATGCSGTAAMGALGASAPVILAAVVVLCKKRRAN